MESTILSGLPMEKSFAGRTAAPQVGHDLSRFDKRRKVRQAIAEQNMIDARIRARARAKERRKAHSISGGISLFAVFGFLSIVVLMIMVIFSYVRLTEISADTAALKNELKSLKAEEEALMSEYERNLKLDDIEITAETVYGMTKPSREQIIYLDLSETDRAEILENGAIKNIRENLEKTGENFSSFLAYLK